MDKRAIAKFIHDCAKYFMTLRCKSCWQYLKGLLEKAPCSRDKRIVSLFWCKACRQDLKGTFGQKSMLTG